MIRRVTIISVILAVAATPLMAQKHPNVELGFNAERLYQYGDVESVNLFNGNVVIPIPLGLNYTVNGKLSYKLMLVYNSIVWDFQERTDCGFDCVIALPSRYSNAGLGWRLSLGRLHAPGEAINEYTSGVTASWIYVSPTGEMHAFGRYNDFDPSDDIHDPVQLAKDHSGIRFIHPDSHGAWPPPIGASPPVPLDENHAQVEFPNGELHTFEKVQRTDGQRSSYWRLVKIEDRPASGPVTNYVQITYVVSPDERDHLWTITDSANRTHRVTFIQEGTLGSTEARGQVVQKVEFQVDASSYATYDFDYGVESSRPSLSVPCGHQPTSTWTPQQEKTARLNVVAQPDGTRFEFTYNTSTCTVGTLDVLTLPTGGSVDYDHGEYAFPFGVCGGILTNRRNIGITARHVRTRQSHAPAEVHTWSYIQTSGKPEPLTDDQKKLVCDSGCLENTSLNDCKVFPPSQWYTQPVDPVRWTRNTVLSPSVNGKHIRTDNYFRAWNGSHPVTGAVLIPDSWGETLGENTYALPIATGAPPTTAIGAPPTTAIGAPQTQVDDEYAGVDTPDDTVDRFLSTRTFENCLADGSCSSSAAGTSPLLRSTYLRYVEKNYGYLTDVSRVVSERDTCVAPSVACFVETRSLNANGLDRFRKTQRGSNYSQVWKVETESTIDYADFATETDRLSFYKLENHPPFGQIWVRQSWLPDLYTETTQTRTVKTARTDGTSTPGPVTAKTKYCFDAKSGFLRGVRVPAGFAATATGDVLTLFDNDKNNVVAEKFFGGDNQTIGLDTCTESGTPTYHIKNVYNAAGILTRSEYVDPASPTTSVLTMLDRTVDLYTSMTLTSADSAGLVTTYTAKTVNGLQLYPPRIGEIQPPETARTTYDYTNATASVNASAKATTDGGPGNLLETIYRYDGFGRLAEQDVLMPNNERAVSDARYDAFGRKHRVTEPHLATAPTSTIGVTKTEFDGLGRPTKITAGDGDSTTDDEKITTFAYAGDRQRTRNSKINSTDTPVSVVETYDSEGRLVGVSEGGTTAEYEYDIGGRLSEAKVTSGTLSQIRTFQYDNRGFLTFEKHPESDVTLYGGYDARGLPSEKKKLLTSPFDVRMTYDKAERLTNVVARNPWALTEYRPFKEFLYATTNATIDNQTSYGRGKLESSTRWNYPPSQSDLRVFKVTEAYEYVNAGGRPSAKRTIISRDENGSGQFWLLKDVRIEYLYNTLGLRSEVKYPACLNCGWATGTVGSSYGTGKLAGIDVRWFNDPPETIVQSTAYWPAGVPKQIAHGNSMVEQRDVDALSRPKRIRFGQYTVCTRPLVSVTVNPENRMLTGTGTVTITVFATGTSPYTYAWYTVDSYNVRTLLPGETNQILSRSVSATTTFMTAVTNACGTVYSELITITVNACTPAQITEQPPNTPIVITKGGTVAFAITASGTAPLTYNWFRGRLNDTTVEAATTSSFTTPPTDVTTYYWARVTNDCNTTGAKSFEYKVVVPLDTPGTLTAIPSAPDAVSLTWGASSSAHHYQAERRSQGGAFVKIADVTGTSYVDSGRTAGIAYVYRVRAVDAENDSASIYTNNDSATIMTFTSIGAGSLMYANYFNEVLGAINLLRAANGSAALTWAQILPAGIAAPANGVPISASHLAVLRTYMDDALQAMGVATPLYSDHSLPLTSAEFRAIYISELQARMQ